MLVIDDNRTRLLAMKEKLLEYSTDKSEQLLEDYKNLAIEIDSEIFNAIVKKISDVNYYGLPLKEQLEFLLEISDDYNGLNELQHRYRSVYKRHSNQELILSDIDNILIDQIRNRISYINGYLLNLDKLEKNRLEIGRLSKELIDQEHRKDSADNKFYQFENDLIKRMLQAKGRIFDGLGNEIATDLISEYSKIGVDLEKILSDKTLLESYRNKLSSELVSEEDRLSAAEICYRNLGDSNSKKLYDNCVNDIAKARYKFILIEIIYVISNIKKGYEELRNKRLQLDDLIKLRLACLERLNVKFVIDPFKMLKIQEQLEVIESLGDISKRVASIRESLNLLVNETEKMESKNNEYIISLSEKIELYSDKKTMQEVVDTYDIINSSIPPLDNDKRVIGIRKIKDSFNIARVKAKTDGVIARVIQLINDVKEISKVSIVPELVVSPSGDEIQVDNQIIESITTNENDNGNSNSNGIIGKQEDMAVEFGELPEIEERKDILPDYSNTLVNEGNETYIDIPFELGIGNSGIEEGLFNEVKPFDDISLFDEKYDDREFQKPDLRIDLSSEEPVNPISKISDFIASKNQALPVNNTQNNDFWTTKDNDTKVKKLVA